MSITGLSLAISFRDSLVMPTVSQRHPTDSAFALACACVEVFYGAVVD